MDIRRPKVEDSAGQRPAAASMQTAKNPFRALDHAKEAWMARLTGGFSPAALTLAFLDWSIHLAVAPGRQWELATLAGNNATEIIYYLLDALLGQAPPLKHPSHGDARFRAPAWQTEPYRFWQQTFLFVEQWWDAATHQVPGTTHHHEDVVSFCARQMLDVLAPANFALTNPEVAQRTAASFGMNLVNGVGNMLDDARRLAMGRPPAGTEQFKVGVDIAVTPGSVVFRNHLIELIQYRPTTDKVAAQPVLIVPSWIMKYYILDLSPHNSLVRYLVEKGHTVFCISWRNVDAADRDLGFDDYRRLGMMAALDAISHIVEGQKIHAAGYCLGGTLLAIGAAAMAHAGDDRLASMTLLAAQTDFAEPGELQLFIDESQVYFLESMMWERGYLAADQMSMSFQLLNSRDLIWSRAIHDYLLGERSPVSDLIAWNADSTRMPYRMHCEYLHQLFLDNDLASGRYRVDGKPVSLRNVRVPVFIVATERDHVSPWRSVYKIHALTDTDVMFVLTSGGHNAGIVSEPGHPNRYFRIKATAEDELNVGPDEWLGIAEQKEGSWWPAWNDWLNAHCAETHVAPPAMGLRGAGSQTLASAPGTYVFQK